MLNPLSGYLVLAERLWDSHDYAEAWNFGPDERDDAARARGIAEAVGAVGRGDPVGAGPGRRIRTRPTVLRLDSSKARARLGWAPALGPRRARSSSIADWYRGYRDGADPRDLVAAQIQAFASARSRRDLLPESRPAPAAG